MKKPLLVALAALLIASPVAAKPIPDVGGGTLTVAPESDLTFGGALVLESTLPSDLPAQGYTYTTVVCLQGGTVVYQWSQRHSIYPSPQTYPLIDQAGLDWPGGAATCVAWLLYTDKPHLMQHTILRLADVTFEVGA